MNAKARVKETGDRLDAASKARREAECDLGDERRKLHEKYNAIIDAEVKPLADRLRELRVIEEGIREANDAAIVACARESNEGHAIGTKLFEWQAYHSFSMHSWHKTGRVGIVEVWERNSRAPRGMSWSLPRVGSKIVRILKKDGTPSAKFERLGSWDAQGWRVEGDDPNRTSGCKG